MPETTVLRDRLRFGEAPRWRNGRLYYSDFYDHRVYALDPTSGHRDVICEVPGQPSGLGWLPDGRLLVVSMLDRKVLRQEADGELVEHADLSEVATFHANDMVVDSQGRAYVGNFGFDLHGVLAERGEAGVLADPTVFPTARLALVDPDGRVRAAADDLRFPNGSALINGGRTLVVAETLGLRLTAFDVADDGTLSGRRVWAQFENVAPDGICVDAEGTIWVANALGNVAVRVAEGGRSLERVQTQQACFAVALGGPDGETLFCCTAPTSMPSVVAESRLGAIEQARVGAGSVE